MIFSLTFIKHFLLSLRCFKWLVFEVQAPYHKPSIFIYIKEGYITEDQEGGRFK